LEREGDSLGTKLIVYSLNYEMEAWGEVFANSSSKILGPCAWTDFVWVQFRYTVRVKNVTLSTNDNKSCVTLKVVMIKVKRF